MKFLFQFLRRLGAGAPAPVAPPDPPTQPPPLHAYNRLEIQSVIIQHLEWCVAFNDHLGTESGDAPPRRELPGAADTGLGRWLAQALAQTETPHPLLQELLVEYEQFHRVAGEALALVRADQMHTASTLLNTDFERSRARVLELLRALQRG